MRTLCSSAGVLCALAVSVMGCSSTDDGPNRAESTGPEHAASAVAAPGGAHDPTKAHPPAKIILTAPGGQPQSVWIEVVKEPRELRRGLMYREYLPPDQGMLFLMGDEEEHSFWMKNTLIPLDMLFIGKDKKVAGVVENAEPLTTTSRMVDGMSLYVLEVNGGWCKKHGIGAGATAQFVDVKE